jgi:predicted ATP-dependent serine protease
MLKRLTQVAVDLKQAQEALPCLSYGLPFLDRCRALPGTLVVVGGHSGAGKSYLGLKLLEATLQAGMYVSLEDPEAEVARRAEAISFARQDEMVLCVPKRPRLSLILRDIREAYAQGFNPRMVCVDYVQLIQYDGDIAAFSQTEQIGMIIAELKSLGRELGFVTVLLSQLKRPMREDRSAFPTLWDLRDSSNIENCAEVVILLQDHGDQVEARVAKNKSGTRGTVQWFNRGANGYLECIARPEDDDIFGDVEELPVPARPKLRAVELFAAAS